MYDNHDNHSSIEKWLMIILHILVYDNHSSIEKWFMIILIRANDHHKPF